MNELDIWLNLNPIRLHVEFSLPRLYEWHSPWLPGRSRYSSRHRSDSRWPTASNLWHRRSWTIQNRRSSEAIPNPVLSLSGPAGNLKVWATAGLVWKTILPPFNWFIYCDDLVNVFVSFWRVLNLLIIIKFEITK